MKHNRRIVAGAALVTLLIGAGCSDPTDTAVLEPSFNHGSTPIARHVQLCKEGSSASFTITNGSVPTANLDDGECELVASHPGDASVIDVTITETPLPPGVVLDHVQVDVISVVTGMVVNSTTSPGPTVTVQLRDDEAVVVTYFNEEISTEEGRMTGGGNMIRVGDGVRITGGLTLHCDITLSNNLEVNWEGGNNWHLDKPITSALCIDDPNIDQKPPRAPFDTFIGEGLGKLNGVDGSLIRFTFTDAGEPGSNDFADIKIWAPGANPSVDAPVLSVAGFLNGGNLQAHFDQPHSK